MFNSKLPSVLPYSQSKFQLETNASSAEVMMTSIGQGKTQMSPYHMALITSAIANGGILMEPYLVDHIENYTGSVIDKNMPHKYAELMTSEEAAHSTAMKVPTHQEDPARMAVRITTEVLNGATVTSLLMQRHSTRSTLQTSPSDMRPHTT